MRSLASVGRSRRAFCLTAMGLGLALTTGGTLAQGAPMPWFGRAYTVVLDAGHGGSNLGCESHDGRLREKQLSAVLVEELAEELRRRSPEVDVRLTRETDTEITLAERMDIARAHGADLFLSLHANASPKHNQTGYETYVLTRDASTRERRRAGIGAMWSGGTGRRAVVDGLVEIVRRDADAQLAFWFARRLQSRTRGQFPRRMDRGVRQADFDVLHRASMPAVLHEIGFLDHASEGPLIRSDTGRRKIVTAIADAVIDYWRRLAFER